MSKNGPYAGPPWSSGGPGESYSAPADPWSDTATPPPPPDQWTASGPPTNPTTGYWNQPPPPQQPWGQAPPAPPRRRNTPIVALVAILGLLICGGLGTTGWLITRASQGTASPTPSPAPETSDVSQPEPRSSADARFVERGQCVRNEGSAEAPEMKIVTCAGGTYEVLRRIDGRTTGETDAEQKCGSVANYTKWYFYDSELDELDFVLCLRDHG